MNVKTLLSVVVGFCCVLYLLSCFVLFLFSDNSKRSFIDTFPIDSRGILVDKNNSQSNNGPRDLVQHRTFKLVLLLVVFVVGVHGRIMDTSGLQFFFNIYIKKTRQKY